MFPPTRSCWCTAFEQAVALGKTYATRISNDELLQYCFCRDTINVGWDGRIYDCDFNQQLELGMGTAGTNAQAMEKLRSLEVWLPLAVVL